MNHLDEVVIEPTEDGKHTLFGWFNTPSEGKGQKMPLNDGEKYDTFELAMNVAEGVIDEYPYGVFLSWSEDYDIPDNKG